MTAGAATEVAYCDAFRPIGWSSLDTLETIKEVKAHNAVGVALCKWKPGVD